MRKINKQHVIWIINVYTERKQKNRHTYILKNGKGVHINFRTGCTSHTRGEVIPFVPKLSLAVQFLLSQFVQQTLMLIPVMRRSSAADTVALVVWGVKRPDKQFCYLCQLVTSLITGHQKHFKLDEELVSWVLISLSLPSLFLLCPLPLLRRFLGVLLREARLACAEALCPALKVFVTVLGSTVSGTLLKLSCDALSNRCGCEWRLAKVGEEDGDSCGSDFDRFCLAILFV